LACGTLNAVSSIPSGAKTRSRRNSPSVVPAARALLANSASTPDIGSIVGQVAGGGVAGAVLTAIVGALKNKTAWPIYDGGERQIRGSPHALASNALPIPGGHDGARLSRDTIHGMGYRERRVHQPQTDRPMTPALQKVALVTGAARGIGLAVAKRFLA
jgi:hypothetical protein